jgi:two-component sensor histidine kinase
MKECSEKDRLPTGSFMTDRVSASDLSTDVELLQARLAELEEEQRARHRADGALAALVAGSAPVGRAFFPSLARHLSEALDVRYTIITRTSDDDPPKFETLAVWAGDRLNPNSTYPIRNTPCERVFQNGVFHCVDGICEMFPEDAELVGMAAVGYAGVRVDDPEGRPIGHLCAIDVKPLPEAKRVTSIMLMFANRVAGELERLRREEQRVAMVRELDHRVKNTLWSVMSIAESTLSASASLEAFGPAFLGRIQSLAIAHEKLAEKNWRGAELRELAARMIAPHVREERDRFTLDGPEVMLPATIAPPLCMVLHELLTNALKYGSLSAPGGTVTIRWSVTPANDAPPYLRLTWAEKGGPAIDAAPRSGYGTKLIRELIPYQIRGDVDLTLAEAGARCNIGIPLAPNDAHEPEET